jgi:hypothetical protein
VYSHGQLSSHWNRSINGVHTLEARVVLFQLSTIRRSGHKDVFPLRELERCQVTGMCRARKRASIRTVTFTERGKAVMSDVLASPFTSIQRPTLG